jgi:hypothetical protein
MTNKESEAYFILAGNMIHVVKGGIRLCTDESDFNVKYDPSANLFATYCPKCQSKKFR